MTVHDFLATSRRIEMHCESALTNGMGNGQLVEPISRTILESPSGTCLHPSANGLGEVGAVIGVLHFVTRHQEFYLGTEMSFIAAVSLASAA